MMHRAHRVIAMRTGALDSDSFRRRLPDHDWPERQRRDLATEPGRRQRRERATHP
jgi:hypothetical protein